MNDQLYKLEVILSSQKIVTFQLFLVLWLFITKVWIVCVSNAFETRSRNKEVLRRLRSAKRFKSRTVYGLTVLQHAINKKERFGIEL